MAEVKWIKLTTDMFDNRKIKYLRRLPDGNSIVLIWVMLLTMAGRCNAGGMIFLTENIPYTPKMLADELGFEENTVKLALGALESCDMVVMNRGHFTVAGWEEYQNIEGMDKIREQNRIRQAKFKEKQKALPGNVTVTLPLTLGNATEEDKEEEIELDLDKDKRDTTDLRSVVDLYHSICISFPKIRSLSESRKKAIKARLKTYSLDDFKLLFENTEASSFLKGKNDRNWTATFDWLLKDSNMAKVLEGNYADKESTGRKEKTPEWLGARGHLGAEELAAIKRAMEEANNTPEVQQERAQLEKELQAFGRGAL